MPLSSMATRHKHDQKAADQKQECVEHISVSALTSAMAGLERSTALPISPVDLINFFNMIITSSGLESRVSLTCTDTDGTFDRQNENFAITDFLGIGG